MTVQTITTEHGYTYLECSCKNTAIRLRTQRNGIQIYALQCLDCGRQIRAVSKNAPEVLEMPERMPFDDGLHTRWMEKQRELRAESAPAVEAIQTARQIERRADYQAYLLTTDWRLKRQAVLTRADNWCEGCRARQATEVHHTTYKHIFNEFLFELVALCSECHRRFHAEV